MRVAGYLRVSTEGQVENGFGLPEQREKVLEFCRRNAYSLVEMVADEAVSGRLEERQGLSRILALADARAIDGIVAVRLDRLGRQNRIAQDILHQVRARGVRVWFTEHGSGERPSERLQENIHGSFAEYEWQLVRERTMNGRNRKAQEKRVAPNGRAPYGFKCISKAEAQLLPEYRDRDGEYEVIEDEAAIVRELFERYAAGSTLRGLAVTLQERGIRTRNGLPFRRSVVFQLLQNPAYKGTPEFNKREYRSGSHSSYRVRPPEERIQLSCPAIVTEKLWEAVAVRLRENQTMMAGRPSANYPLRGVVFCGACVSARGGATRCCGQSNGHGSRWYVCNSRTPDGGRTGCSSRCRAEELEEMARIALTEAAAPGRLAALERRRAERMAAQAGDPEAEIRSIQRDLEKLDAAEARVKGAFRNGTYSEQDLREELGVIREDRLALQQRLAVVQTNARSIEDPNTAEARGETWAARLRAALADPERFAELCRLLLTVRVHPNRDPEVEVRVPMAL